MRKLTIVIFWVNKSGPKFLENISKVIFLPKRTKTERVLGEGFTKQIKHNAMRSFRRFFY